MKISRISHTEVDLCRVQPREWVKQRLSPQSTFRKIGYNQTLLGGIYKFHKSQSASIARDHLQQLLANRDFKDLDRVHLLEQDLEKYIEWYNKSDSASADHRIRLKYKVGFLELRGEIGRVDVLIQGGYRAILLGEPRKNWQRELRMPLLQLAVADKYSAPVDEFEVGVQELDGSGLVTIGFSKKELDKAKDEFRKLGQKVQQLAP